MTLRRERWLEAGWLLSLLLPIAVLLAPVVFGGQAPLPDYLRYFVPWLEPAGVKTAWNPLWYDAVGQYWPWRTLLHDGLRANALPYWNPWQLCGYSFVGNGQSALFYPVNWVCFGLFSVPTGFRLTALFHLWLAAAGTCRVLRELGAGRPAAWLSGAAFALSGFLVTWLMLPTLVSSAAWLPLGVALVERARRTGRLAPAAWAGACVGLSALAGHPQIFYYVALTVLGLGALRLLPRRWPALAWAAAVAGLVAAPGVLPVLELAPRGHRPPVKSAEGYGAFLGRAIPADWLVTLTLPDWYGSPDRGTAAPVEVQPFLRGVAQGHYWGADRRGAISPGDYTEFNVFVGLLPLLLALYSALFGPKVARLYLGVALLALWLAFGSPLNRLLYFGLPGWSAGAGPCRLALVWAFGVAVSAGLGFEALWADASRLRRLAACATGLAVAMTLAALLSRAVATTRGLGPALEAAGFAHLVAGTLAVVVLAVAAGVAARAPRWLPALAAAELLAFGWGFNPTCPPELLAGRDHALVRQELLGHDRVVFLDPPEAWGFYRPPAGLLQPPNLATISRVRDVGGYDSLLPARHKQRVFEAAGGRPVSPAINGNMLLLGHVDSARIDGVAATVGPSGVTASETPRTGLAPARGARGRLHVLGGTGAFTHDGANRVALRVTGASAVLADNADPGWRCYTPGQAAPRPWQATAEGWRTVAADGAQDLRWVYQPMTVRAGLFAALLALAALAGLTAFVKVPPLDGEHSRTPR